MALEQKQISDLAVMIVLSGGLTGVFYLYRREIAEWLIGNFRGGGPRPPSHPLPGNEGFIVRRRRRRDELRP